LGFPFSAAKSGAVTAANTNAGTRRRNERFMECGGVMRITAV
jgi:hypothetical protein